MTQRGFLQFLNLNPHRRDAVDVTLSFDAGQGSLRESQDYRVQGAVLRDANILEVKEARAYDCIF